ETQGDPTCQELGFRAGFIVKWSVRLRDCIRGCRMVGAQRAPHFASPEVPPLFGIGEIGGIGIERAKERPDVIVGTLAPQGFQPRKKRGRAAGAFFRKLEGIHRRLRLERLPARLIFFVPKLVAAWFRLRGLAGRRSYLPVLGVNPRILVRRRIIVLLRVLLLEANRLRKACDPERMRLSIYCGLFLLYAAWDFSMTPSLATPPDDLRFPAVTAVMGDLRACSLGPKPRGSLQALSFGSRR